MSLNKKGVPWAMLAPGLLLLIAFLAIPMGMLLANSFVPYDASGAASPRPFTLENYSRFLSDYYYWSILGRTLRIALETTVGSIVLGFPSAVFITRQRPLWRAILTAITIAPMFINVLVRTLGWYFVLGREGLLAQFLGLFIDDPPGLLYTETATVIGLVQAFIPLVVLCVMSSLLQLDPLIMRAAADLGASERYIFWKIICPLSTPGILAGAVLTFTLCCGTFAVPALLGGERVKVMAYMIYQNQILLLNWPFGAALTVVLLVAVCACLFVYQARVRRISWIANLEGLPC